MKNPLRASEILTIATFLLLGAYFLSISFNPSEWHFLDTVHLIFHEAGHFIFFFLGEFIQIAGGTIMQLLIPAVCIVYFYVHKQRLSAYFLLFWLGHSFVNISVYAGDAIAMQLPLLGGGSVIHDWNYLLSSMYILSATPIISNILFGIGFSLYIIAMYLGIWEVVKTSKVIMR